MLALQDPVPAGRRMQAASIIEVWQMPQSQLLQQGVPSQGLESRAQGDMRCVESTWAGA